MANLTYSSITRDDASSLLSGSVAPDMFKLGDYVVEFNDGVWHGETLHDVNTEMTRDGLFGHDADGNPNTDLSNIVMRNDAGGNYVTIYTVCAG